MLPFYLSSVLQGATMNCKPLSTFIWLDGANIMGKGRKVSLRKCSNLLSSSSFIKQFSNKCSFDGTFDVLLNVDIFSLACHCYSSFLVERASHWSGIKFQLSHIIFLKMWSYLVDAEDIFGIFHHNKVRTNFEDKNLNKIKKIF